MSAATGHRTGSRRAWGWHRLGDEWAARIVAAAGIRPGDLVLQRAAVRKYTSGRVRGFTMAAGLTVPRRAFRPPPQVDSAVLVIRRR